MENTRSKLSFLKPALRKYFQFIESRQKYPITLVGELIGTQRPLIRDVSSNQGVYNVDVSVLNGVEGIYIRSSYGLLLDQRFAYNYNNAGKHPIWRTSYHVFYPQYDLTAQLDNWYKMHPEIDIVPRVIDMEVIGGKSYSFIADYILNAARIIKARDGVMPILYSRANIMNAVCQTWTTEELNSFYVILAQYLFSGAEHQGPPTLPNRLQRERVIMHQTSDHKVDFPNEADSFMIDWNRWELGTSYDMKLFIEKNWGIGFPSPSSWHQDVDTYLRARGFTSNHSVPKD